MFPGRPGGARAPSPRSCPRGARSRPRREEGNRTPGTHGLLIRLSAPRGRRVAVGAAAAAAAARIGRRGPSGRRAWGRRCRGRAAGGGGRRLRRRGVRGWRPAREGAGWAARTSLGAGAEAGASLSSRIDKALMRRWPRPAPPPARPGPGGAAGPAPASRPPARPRAPRAPPVRPPPRRAPRAPCPAARKPPLSPCQPENSLSNPASSRLPTPNLRPGAPNPVFIPLPTSLHPAFSPVPLKCLLRPPALARSSPPSCLCPHPSFWPRPPEWSLSPACSHFQSPFFPRGLRVAHPQPHALDARVPPLSRPSVPRLPFHPASLR